MSSAGQPWMIRADLIQDPVVKPDEGNLQLADDQVLVIARITDQCALGRPPLQVGARNAHVVGDSATERQVDLIGVV
jgi:hypothetical protein